MNTDQVHILKLHIMTMLIKAGISVDDVILLKCTAIHFNNDSAEIEINNDRYAIRNPYLIEMLKISSKNCICAENEYLFF
ncbi:hypothetical protein [Gottfriedia solisilvae]|uniref:hypothetical protein n=1 Tax=Gottfriedia solisilvae TaxID=1516104 RepID=UPI003D2EEBE6